MILLPWPKQMEEGNGNFSLDFDAMLVMEPSCPAGVAVYAQMLKDEIFSCTGFEIPLTRGCAKKGDIRLRVEETEGKSQYSLVIKEDGISICGTSLAFLGYGVQTLRQLLRQYAGLLPVLHIGDWPDFGTRGFFHDVTRGRVQTLPNLKKMADTMAFYKLNHLELYIEHTYLFRGLTELWRDETPLTAQEIMELDVYCAERGIELVPSLASFGHLYKLLGTRTYADLCERSDSVGQEFSFWDRMEHHTLNPVDERSMALATGLIGEFMQLFRSDKFNICADETFDLGTGRSKEVAEERGKDVLYAEFVSGLFDFLVKNGKTPMFWGDIICESPELLRKFPKEVVCLAWGYSEREEDTQVKILHEAGTKLYVCPGTRGWNHWVNQMRESYENITRMCEYGRRYQALGVLNTDWGDYGHIGHPEFSVPGMIYGAVFSWGGTGLGSGAPEEGSAHGPQKEDPKTRFGFEELNRQISVLEFGDASGELVGCLAKVSGCEVFGWADAVQLKEWSQKGRDTAWLLENLRAGGADRFVAARAQAEGLSAKLREICRGMEQNRRPAVARAILALRMICAWNEVGRYLAGVEEMPGDALAKELEQCLFYYKRDWRQNSKEGDLEKISDVFFWYADRLRENGRG